LQIEPENLEVLIKLGEVFLWNKETLDDAEKYLSRAVLIDNKSCDALIAFGWVKEKKGDIDEAINLYE